MVFRSVSESSGSALARPDRLRVCWLVPGFPESAEDPTYAFLGREASELIEAEDVDLLVVVDGPWTGGQPDLFKVWPVVRPSRAVGKAQALWAGLSSDPKRLLSFVSNPKASYPTLWRIGALLQLIRSWKPDVVHSHFAVPNGTCGLPVARALGAASVVSLRGVDLATDERLGYGFRLDEMYEREFRASVANADLCLTATDQMRVLALDAGARDSRTCVLANSFNPSAVDERAEIAVQSEASKLILSVGHLIERKGFDRGVRALAVLPEEYHYLVIGAGPELDRLRALATDLGVSERTRFVGQVPPGKVVPWMRVADCFWFLSRFEAFGNVTLEAFAAGCPIVATSTGVASELAQLDAAVALVNDADDPAELASITRALTRGNTKESRDKLLERFSPNVRSRNLVGGYRAAIAGLDLQLNRENQ